MSETAITILVCVVLFIAVPILLLVLRDRISAMIWRWRNPPEKLAAGRRAYEDRILHPEWDFYERHLQRATPRELRALYSDRRLVLAEGIEFDEAHYISTFTPLDEAELVETRDLFGLDVIPIASSEGDIIYLRPGLSETDAVYITYHDGGDTWQLAPDVSTFLTVLRESNPDI